MPSEIFEFFGFPVLSDTPESAQHRASSTCPFLGTRCEKRVRTGPAGESLPAGVCTIKPRTGPPVICCPNRLYASGYRVLRGAATQAFGASPPLIPGREARQWAVSNSEPCVAVFGHKWGGELAVPRRGGIGSYSVDWILALLDQNGELAQFVAVEVQTIDTTGNYKNGIAALTSEPRAVVATTAGLNWENVNKRILPQLIYKGQLLQREDKCKQGLYFICPTVVVDRIYARLGGADQLSDVPPQPASITFLAYDLDMTSELEGGSYRLDLKHVKATAVSEVQEAFGRVGRQNQNVYEVAIQRALG